MFNFSKRFIFPSTLRSRFPTKLAYWHVRGVNCVPSTNELGLCGEELLAVLTVIVHLQRGGGGVQICGSACLNVK